MTDDDGDGVIGSGDGVRVGVVFDSGELAGTLSILDGATGAELWSRAGVMSGAGSVALVDANGDGLTEVITIDASGAVLALDAFGEVQWQSEDTCFTCAGLTAGDLDADGNPEILVNNLVVNGRDGTTRARLPTWTPLSSVTAADLTGEGALTVLQGGSAYDAQGEQLWTLGVEDGAADAFPMVLQADDDEGGEVAWVGRRFELLDSDGSTLGSTSFGTDDRTPGLPCAADFDGDGAAEIAVPATSELVLLELDGTVDWRWPVSDASGLAGCSAFDFDADGVWEVVYADEESLWILDGHTGEPRFQSDDYGSSTWMEYPVVADVDQDGHADLLVVSEFGAHALTVLTNDGDGWPAAGPGWPIPDYAVTNASASGNIPISMEPSWQFYNMWRARPPVDEAPLADLSVSASSECPISAAGLPLRVTNAGSASVDAGATVAVYDGATMVGSAELPFIGAGSYLDGLWVPVPVWVSPGRLRAVVDAGSMVPECDEANNEYEQRGTPPAPP